MNGLIITNLTTIVCLCILIYNKKKKERKKEGNFDSRILNYLPYTTSFLT